MRPRRESYTGAMIPSKQKVTGVFPKLSNDCLVLRAFVPDDAPRVQQLAGAFEIADTTLVIPHPYEDGMAEAWIGGHREAIESGTAVTWALTLGDTDELVGAISLMQIEAGHQAEAGYWIGVPYWRRGYCSKAAEAVTRYAFGELGLVRLYARCFARNPASARVLTKLGFQLEGRQRRHVRKWDAFEDIDLYGLLKAEWRPLDAVHG